MNMKSSEDELKDSKKNVDKNSKNKPKKAVAMMSSGLDSPLAAKLIADQGFEVHALHFHAPYIDCKSKSEGDICGAGKHAENLDIPIKYDHHGDDFLEIIKNPKFGYGKNMNPCIDCRIYILKKAKKYMEEIGAEFIVTGEVLGQRPKSQNITAMKIVEKESGLENKLLRPLSAKVLDETELEKSGLVDRNKLLDIQGRRRLKQVELGREYKLVEDYCAGGGCLLTDKNFSRKLKDYLAHTENPTMKDLKWLKVGRHFRYDGKKIICGRNESENNLITEWAGPEDLLLDIKDIMGPTLIIFNINKNADDTNQLSVEKNKFPLIEFASQILIRYSDSDVLENHITLNQNGDKSEIKVLRNRIDYESYRV
jgi:tRNA-specific 2-thiouridylase